MSKVHVPAQMLIKDIEHKPSLFVKFLNYITIIVTVVCYTIIAYLLFFHFDLIKLFFTDYSKLREFITPGLRVPIYLVSLIFSIVISINPFAQVVPLTSIIAFFYGFIPGVIFGSLSFFFSTYITMQLSRHLGHSVVKKIIGERNWNKVTILANEEGVLPFFIAYLFPIFPNAIISWIAGTTKINTLKLSIWAFIAQFPGIVLSVLIGSGVITKNFRLTGGLFLVLVISAILMSKYRKNILDLMNRKK